MAWRVVRSGMATLEEIDRHWTLLDLDDANDVLDVYEAAATPPKE